MLETTALSSGPAIPVVRIITRLNIGGPSIQAASLSSALAARGFNTTLMHGRLGPGEGDMSYLVAPEVTTVFVPTLGRAIQPLADLRALATLVAELRRRRPRIVHTHMAKAGLLGRMAATIYNLTRGQAPRARLVHTYHGHVLEGYFSPAKTRLFIALERLMARVTDTIVAISPAIKTELLEQYGIGRGEQYRVVPLGFDLSPFAAIDSGARQAARIALDIPAGVPVIATIGRLTAIKQYDLFLEVVARVARAHPQLVAIIAGDGELRADLEAGATALGVRDRVRFLGWRRDLPVIHAAADVFVLTSRNEGTPVALIEAMAAGVAGVSTNVGGVGDVINHPDVGLAVTGVEALADAVTALLSDPVRRTAIGQRARARVTERYSFERLAGDIERLYHDLLAPRI